MEEEKDYTDKLLDHILATAGHITDPIARSILDAQSIEELKVLYFTTSEIREEPIFVRMCTRRKLQILNT